MCFLLLLFFCFCNNSPGLQFLTDKQVKADLRLTNEQWSSSLSDEKSQEFISLTNRIKNVVRMYIKQLMNEAEYLKKNY